MDVSGAKIGDIGMSKFIRFPWLSAIFFLASTGDGLGQSEPLGGAAAFGDWRSDRPGLSRIIRPDDLPKPGATPSVANFPHVTSDPRTPSRTFPQVSRSIYLPTD